MYIKEIAQTSVQSTFKLKVSDYAQLTKLRLSFLVVLSAVLSFFLAVDQFSWIKFISLVIGGFMVTGASNTFNQIIEKDLDKLMSRTEDRPLPANRMHVNEALWLAGIMAVVGVSILWYFLNPLSGVLGALALFTYVAIYTPLKRIHPIAVFVGAFPGAIPPMLGYVAVTGEMGMIPGILFAVQFIWQFPHFWAIAWKVDDDYKKAGFSLLPSRGRKDKSSAFLIFVYCLFLIPVSLLPFLFGISGILSVWVATIAGLWFMYYAVKLFFDLQDKSATQLMFASFFYLPILQIIYLIDKV